MTGKKILFAVMLFMTGSVWAQTNVQTDKSSISTSPQANADSALKGVTIGGWPVKTRLYGFVNNFFCYDSRRSLMVAEELFNILPLDESIGADGRDTNADPSVKFLAITTRMGLDLTGPELFGALSTAKIETDFGGYSATGTLLRIRQAYTALDWRGDNRSQLLIGQTWHPMSGDLKPDVFSLATGSPFNPFNRSPMVRYDHTLNYKYGSTKTTFTAAAIYQFQYASVGMNGAPSYKYSQRGLWPELYVGVSWEGVNDSKTAVGVDVSSIKIDSHRLTSYAAMLSTSFNINYRLFVKAKAVCGQNLSHMLLPSGFGIDTSDGQTTLRPLTAAAAWTTMMYRVKGDLNQTWKVGFMAGALRNLGVLQGTIDPTTVRIWGNHAGVSSGLGEVWRFSPITTYSVRNLVLGLELEHTVAGYGDLQPDGKATDLHSVANNRVCAMVMYNF